MFSAHARSAQLAFLIQYAATWWSAVKPAAIAAHVSWTTAAAAATATADDVTATSDDVITSADDVTASVDDVVVGPAAAAGHDGGREQLIGGAVGDGW